MTIIRILSIMSFSFALISCTDNVHPIIGCNIRPNSERNKDVFKNLLSRGAPRAEVELIAALGGKYEDDLSRVEPSLINSVRRSLEKQGRSVRGFYDNEVYRVSKSEDAKLLLRGLWSESLFDEKFEAFLRQYPNVSVAKMENDDQRIFFFDREGKFVAYLENCITDASPDGYSVR